MCRERKQEREERNRRVQADIPRLRLLEETSPINVMMEDLYQFVYIYDCSRFEIAVVAVVESRLFFLFGLSSPPLYLRLLLVALGGGWRGQAGKLACGLQGGAGASEENTALV